MNTAPRPRFETAKILRRTIVLTASILSALVAPAHAGQCGADADFGKNFPVLAQLPNAPFPPLPPLPPQSTKGECQPCKKSVKITRVSEGKEMVLREISGFTRVIVEGAIDVTLIPGDTQKVALLGNGDAQKSIEVVQEGDRIRIRNKGNGWWGWSKDDDARIAITATKALNNITMAGSGNINADQPLEFSDITFSVAGSGDVRIRQVQADQMRLSVAGSGDIQVAGRVNTLNASVAGSGDLNAKALKANEVTVSIAGAGDASVHASQRLTASVAGVGTITYFGNPTQVKKSLAGMGEINQGSAGK